MTRFILDTDTVTLWLQGHEAVTAAVLAQPADRLAIPIIVVEEIWDGWQAAIRAAKSAERTAFAYQRLTQAVLDLRPFPIVPLSEAALTRHVALKKLKLNVGSNDLRIAAVALELGAAVVTNNERDYRRVPGLVVENWAQPQTPTV